jgi:hypothetical protein
MRAVLATEQRSVREGRRWRPSPEEPLPQSMAFASGRLSVRVLRSRCLRGRTWVVPRGVQGGGTTYKRY